MPVENVTTKFKVDISDLKKNIKEANSNIKLYTAELKNASAGMKKGEENADSLTKKIDAQTKIVDAEKAKLQALKDELAKYNDKIKSGKQVIADLTEQQKKAAEEYGKDSEQVKALTKQLDLAEKAQERNETAAKNLNVQIVNQDTAVKNAAGQVETYKDQLKALDTQTQDTGEEMQKATDGGLNAFSVAIGNLAADVVKKAIDKLGELASKAKEAFEEFDKGRDAVIKGTGATGDAAAELTKSYSNVAKTVGADMTTVGKALAEVNTRFGFTGDELEQATKDFLKFSDVTDTDAVTAIQLISRSMGDAGIEAQDYGKILDELTVAYQNSGISVSKLSELLTSYGAPMRALGFDTESAIAIFSQWEKAGVNTATAFSGMKTAISNWASSGKDAREEFKKTVDEIASMPDIASATTKAIEIFGKKAGPDLADAIQGGRFDYADFLSLIQDSGGALAETFDETQSPIDKYQVKINNLKATVGEIFTNLLEKYKPQIDDFFAKVDEWLEKLQPTIENLITWLEENLPVIETEIGAIIAAVVAFKVVTIIQGIITALTGLVAAIQAVGAAQAITNVIMAANPIGLIIAAIAALVALIVIAYNKIDWFREFVDKYFFQGWKDFALWWTKFVTEKIPELGKKFFDWFKSGWTQFSNWWTDKITKKVNSIKAIFEKAPAFFEKLGDGIKGIFKGIANAILATIEDAINFIPSHINDVIGLLNIIPGVDLPEIPRVELPRLAKGGVVNRPTVAQIGENGAEAIIPLEKNKAGLKQIAGAILNEMSGGSAASGSPSSNGNVIYNFNQTNNSPKSLSRWEIYRQTKNLINAAKGV